MSKKYQFDHIPVMVLRLLISTQLTPFVKIDHIDLNYIKLFLIFTKQQPQYQPTYAYKIILLMHLQTNNNLSGTIAECFRVTVSET